MANRMKEYERLGRSYANRWETSRSGGNVAETYAAARDYRENIAKQEEELKGMDPNSKEYERAEQAIDEQKSTLWEMEYRQRREFSDGQVQGEMQTLQARNDQIASQMSAAVQKGDSARYDQLRSQYEKNMSVQEQLGTRMKSDGVQFEDTLHRQKVAEQNLDIDMRDAMAARVSQQTERGKAPRAEDQEALDRYSAQVRQDEVAVVKMQNEQKIQGMRERGESEEHIKYQEEENARVEKWVRDINGENR